MGAECGGARHLSLNRSQHMEKRKYSGIPARILASSFAIAIALAGIAARDPANAQSVNATDRDRGHVMLKTLKNEI